MAFTDEKIKFLEYLLVKICHDSYRSWTSINNLLAAENYIFSHNSIQEAMQSLLS